MVDCGPLAPIDGDGNTLWVDDRLTEADLAWVNGQLGRADLTVRYARDQSASNGMRLPSERIR